MPTELERQLLELAARFRLLASAEAAESLRISELIAEEAGIDTSTPTPTTVLRAGDELMIDENGLLAPMSSRQTPNPYRVTACPIRAPESPLNRPSAIERLIRRGPFDD